MGIIHITLDHPGYSQLSVAMQRLGYLDRVTSIVDGEERWLGLPDGTYWRPEPSSSSSMIEDAQTALAVVDDLGAKVVVASGQSAWWGLLPVEGSAP